MTATLITSAPVSSTLSAFGDLAWSRPAPGADAVTVAAWYERKADVLHHLAGEDPARQETYERWAADAHAHAVRLRPTTSVTST